MKYFRFIIISVCIFIFFGSSFAQNRHFGLGLIIGEPTGISAKLWTSPTSAFDFGLGVSIGGDRIAMYDGQYNNGSRIHLHFDYLLHEFNALNSTNEVPVYYGIGARFNSGGGYDNSLAIRFVIGLAWMPNESPIDMFIEFVPSLQLTPDPGFAIDSAVGARYYF